MNFLTRIYEYANNFRESWEAEKQFNELRENLIQETQVDPDDLDFYFESYERTIRSEIGISNVMNINAKNDLYWTNRVNEFKDFAILVKEQLPRIEKTDSMDFADVPRITLSN